MCHENRLANFAADAGELGLWEIFFGTRCYVQSARNRALMGFSPDQIHTNIDDWINLIKPNDRSAALAALHACIAGTDEFVCEYDIVSVSGQDRRVLSRGFVVRDAIGRPTGIQGVSRDIGKDVAADVGLARLAAIVAASDNAIISVGLDGVITNWNLSAEQLYGYSADEAIGQPISRTVPEEYREAHWNALAAIGRGEVPEVVNEFRLAKSGHLVPVSVRVLPIRNSLGQIVGATAIVHDRSGEYDVQERFRTLESEREQLERRAEFLQAQAEHQVGRDPLTGLLNHAAFQQKLDTVIAHAQSHGEEFVFAHVDIDNFRFFNEAYGHLAGDDLLRKVAAVLASLSGPADLLARYGDDAFAFVRFDRDPSALGQFQNHLRREISNLSYEPPGCNTRIPLSVSIGCAFYPVDSTSRVELIRIADDLLRCDRAGSDEGVIEAERLRAELTQTRDGFGILNALVTAVDNKDRYTRRHSEDVMKYCVQLAREMGWAEASQRRVAVAALLHDVGKIGVPDYVLRKPGSLTTSEYDAMKQHPQMGAIMVTSVPGFEETIDAVRHHHERWDGEGYPFGLKGLEIPEIARLMAVADAYSAMTTDRPYRKSLAPSIAKTRLRMGAGSQWDPRCVEAFLRAEEQARPRRRLKAAG